jgi:predicted transposase YbfD/YdcC
MVSAWASRQRLVLGQEAVATKSNEIKAIPLLLARLELTGAIVTIDAIGTQTAIWSAPRPADGTLGTGECGGQGRASARWRGAELATGVPERTQANERKRGFAFKPLFPLKAKFHKPVQPCSHERNRYRQKLRPSEGNH